MQDLILNARVPIPSVSKNFTYFIINSCCHYGKSWIVFSKRAGKKQKEHEAFLFVLFAVAGGLVNVI
jgi:hypothetical protein